MRIDALSHYSPWTTLFIGIVTYVGLHGLGKATLALIRCAMPSPWMQVASLATGIGVFSIAIQIVAMMGLANAAVLILIWAVALILGFQHFIRGISWPFPKAKADTLTVILVVCTAGCALLVLIIALAPSTKIDETFYHMLVPARIVEDHALRFYQEPWEGAILPQMAYQIAAAPFHAMNHRDASNVLSWCVFVTLLWFIWTVIAAESGNRHLASLVCLCVACGMYASSNYSAAGSHAPQDLFSCALVIGYVHLAKLRAEWGIRSISLLIGILIASSISTKISLGPLAWIIGIFSIREMRPGSRHEWLVMSAGLLLPSFVLCGPLSLWTWLHSGSPLGPMLAGRLGPSVYRDGIVQWEMADSFRLNAFSVSQVIRDTLLSYSPLIWAGVFGVCSYITVARRTRFVLAILFIFQLGLVWLFLTHSARFLGGLPYALCILTAIEAGRSQLLARTHSRLAIATLAVVFAIPWFALQIYYVRLFIPQMTGGDRREQFERSQIALLEDYRSLDQSLPNDAVLFNGELVRLPNIYAPRPIFTNPVDIPGTAHHVYQMTFTFPGLRQSRYDVSSWKFGQCVYVNTHAIIGTYRTPGRKPDFGTLTVTEVISR